MSQFFKYVGQTLPVHDASLKVRGELVYGSDMTLPNMLFAKLLLSPVAHGAIKKIDTSNAEKLPGVIKIFSYLNAPEKKYSRYRIVPGQESCPEDECLFTDKVRYVGDRVAVVVATSLAIAKKAVTLIDVEYEELPVLSTPEEALTESDVKIHPMGNLLHEYEVKLGEQSACTEAGITVETETRTQRIHHAAIETHVSIANYDSSGKLTVWAACQGVYALRTILADFLGLSYNNVRVIKLPVGGSFGGKQEAVLDPLTAFLAKAMKRPVKLMLDREESIVATFTRPATTATIKTHVTSEGIVRDCLIESVFDAGAYATSSVDNAHAMSAKIPKLYRIPYYRHQCKVVYTNTIVAGGARGWGAPEILTPMEVHMDAVAKKINMDPVEIRLKNLVHPYDVDAGYNLSLGDARVIECLEQGATAFRWQERYNNNPGHGRYVRGVGVACAAHKNGMYGGFPEHSTMTLKMNEDGSFILNAGLHDVGCGTLTSMKQIAAEVLDVDLGLITVLEADSDTSPYDFGSFGSRVTYICGACAYETASKLKEFILECAALILQKPKQYLKVENGCVYVMGNDPRKLTYKEVAITAKMRHNKDIILTNTYHGTSNPGVYAAHFAEVEVDTDTGLARVTDYLAVQDIGKAINPGMVEGQIQGAVQMGIGYALCEEVKIKPDGTVVNNSFKNYHVINAPDMPTVKVLLVEKGDEQGPFGAKSVGEIANVPVAAAVINAINNALGTSLSNMPLTPEKILAALKLHKQTLLTK